MLVTGVEGRYPIEKKDLNIALNDEASSEFQRIGFTVDGRAAAGIRLTNAHHLRRRGSLIGKTDQIAIVKGEWAPCHDTGFIARGEIPYNNQ